MATLREEQVARVEMQEALEAERVAAREALKQERAEKVVALARAQELKRMQGITQYRLWEVGVVWCRVVKGGSWGAGSCWARVS